MQFKSICGSIVAMLVATQVAPASAQLIPEPWVTVGSKDSAVTYSAGVRFFDLGAEIGTGPKGVTGFDALKFFSLPFVVPYAGLGYYDKGLAYSGGVQFTPPGNVFYGVGYHSVRGINGQLGIKF